MATKKIATKTKAAKKKAAPARKPLKPTAKVKPKKAPAKAKKSAPRRRKQIDPATAPTVAAGIKFNNAKRGSTTTINVGLNIAGNAPGAVAVTATCPPGNAWGSGATTEEISGNIDTVSVYVLGASAYSATYPDSAAVQSVGITMDSLGNFTSVGWTNSNFTGTQVLPVSSGS